MSSTVNETGVFALHLDSVPLVEHMDDFGEHGFVPGAGLVNGFVDGQDGHGLVVTDGIVIDDVSQHRLPRLRVSFPVRYQQAEFVPAIVRYAQRLAGVRQTEVVQEDMITLPRQVGANRVKALFNCGKNKGRIFERTLGSRERYTCIQTWQRHKTCSLDDRFVLLLSLTYTRLFSHL